MKVLVTGANRGLGLEFVKQYAEDGATVFACCRDPHTAKAMRAMSDAAGGKVSMHALDVTDAKAIAALAKDFGDEPIDVLINNAGVYGPGQQSAEEMDYEGWAKTFATNTMAPLCVAQAFHRNLKNGKDKKLVTITSRMGSTAESSGGYLAYRSSKAAVNNVMRGLSLAWKEDGIVVSLLHPGWVKTDMGGKGADLEPHESVAGMRRVIAGLSMAKSGTFLSYRGDEIPW